MDRNEKRRRARAARSPEQRERDNKKVRDYVRMRRATDPEFRARHDESVRRFKSKNPDYWRGYVGRYGAAWRAKKRYGTTIEALDQMQIAQQNLCAVCGSELKAFHVDHCHATGKVRGLLCRGCNMGLGQFQDDADRLAKAAEYIRLHK